MHNPAGAFIISNGVYARAIHLTAALQKTILKAVLICDSCSIIMAVGIAMKYSALINYGNNKRCCFNTFCFLHALAGGFTERKLAFQKA